MKLILAMLLGTLGIFGTLAVGCAWCGGLITFGQFALGSLVGFVLVWIASKCAK